MRPTLSLRLAARLISRVERGDPSVGAELDKLKRSNEHQLACLGITGPPGVGKSTLVDVIIQALRARGETVAVLAVDPSSPLSGGAILGDRVRMHRHSSDNGVFIRSMANRNKTGGLAKAVGRALQVIRALEFDHVIVETVGVGQSEMDIVLHAKTVLLVQSPDSGDDIQASKAGLLEALDVCVVNKMDRPGASRTANTLRQVLKQSASGWKPPVITASAQQQRGIDDVLRAVKQHRIWREEHLSDILKHRQGLLAEQLKNALAQALLERSLTSASGKKALQECLNQIETGGKCVEDAANRLSHKIWETRL